MKKWLKKFFIQLLLAFFTFYIGFYWGKNFDTIKHNAKEILDNIKIKRKD